MKSRRKPFPKWPSKCKCPSDLCHFYILLSPVNHCSLDYLGENSWLLYLLLWTLNPYKEDTLFFQTCLTYLHKQPAAPSHQLSPHYPLLITGSISNNSKNTPAKETVIWIFEKQTNIWVFGHDQASYISFENTWLCTDKFTIPKCAWKDYLKSLLLLNRLVPKPELLDSSIHDSWDRSFVVFGELSFTLFHVQQHP